MNLVVGGARHTDKQAQGAAAHSNGAQWNCRI